MLLTLRILTYRNQAVPPAPGVRFNEEGGNIGRSPDNALVLDDPSKFISRVHARVAAQDGAFVLEDLGANPSVVNDRPVGKGQSVSLAHGDRVLIGDYLLQVVVEAGPVAPLLAPAPLNNAALPLFEPPPQAPPRQLPPLDFLPSQPAAPAPGPVATPAFLDPLAGSSLLDVMPGQQFGSDDPLGLNLFAPGPVTPARAAESDHVSPELAALPCAAPPMAFAGAPAAPITAAGGFAIPHDYDPLADFFAPAAPAAAPPVPAPAPAAMPPLPAQPDPPGADVTTLTAEPAPEAALPAPPAPAPAPPVPAPAPAPIPAASDDPVMAALLRGLGLPNLQLQRPPEEVAGIVGAMLREATAGTIDVLMARALTKKESRIDMTMLSVRANNPLKFFPNADGALTQMLTGAMAGYLEPVDAMAGAFDDLRAHELAVIAGMRAALGAVLHRFDPSQIEARLALPTVMDRMLWSSRKAKMWDRLVELYDEIAREADDDLQRLYGEKFSAAYEEQVARLRQARH